MKKLIVVLVMIVVGFQLSAQSSKMPISVAYYAPYGINPGVKVGTSFQLKQSENTLQTLSISPQIGWWSSRVYGNNFHRTFLLDAHLDYKRYTSARKFYGIAGIGLSYQLARERSALTVNIGSGDRTPEVNFLHQAIPTFNLGFGQQVNQLNYYFKGFVGQQFASKNGNSLFLGAELGFIFFLKNDKN